jgi:hypothetical protein
MKESELKICPKCGRKTGAFVTKKGGLAYKETRWVSCSALKNGMPPVTWCMGAAEIMTVALWQSLPRNEEKAEFTRVQNKEEEYKDWVYQLQERIKELEGGRRPLFHGDWFNRLQEDNEKLKNQVTELMAENERLKADIERRAEWFNTAIGERNKALARIKELEGEKFAADVSRIVNNIKHLEWGTEKPTWSMFIPIAEEEANKPPKFEKAIKKAIIKLDKITSLLFDLLPEDGDK